MAPVFGGGCSAALKKKKRSRQECRSSWRFFRGVMQDQTWARGIAQSPDPVRVKARIEHLKSTPLWNRLKKSSSDQVQIMVQLFAGSQALGDLILAKPEWFDSTLSLEALQHPRQRQGLEREIEKKLLPLIKASSFTEALENLRHFKQRELLRI